MYISNLLVLIVVHLSYAVLAENAVHLEFPETNVQSNTDQIFKNDLETILRERVVGTADHEVVKQYIIDTLRDLAWDVETDEFNAATPFGEKTFKNIIATHNPDAKYRLVFACHYDSKYYEHFSFVGATDSAVPCAMLINLARKLSDKLTEKKNKSLTLQLLFTDGEEAFVAWGKDDSIYGAKHIAEQWADTPWTPTKRSDKTEIDRIKLLVLLDLLGAAQPTIPCYFQNTKSEFNRLVKIQEALNPPVNYFAHIPSASISDDHLPFLNKGVPILHIIPTPFPSVWHTENDNMKALDFTTIANLNRIFLQFVSEYLEL